MNGYPRTDERQDTCILYRDSSREIGHRLGCLWDEQEKEDDVLRKHHEIESAVNNLVLPFLGSQH